VEEGPGQYSSSNSNNNNDEKGFLWKKEGQPPNMTRFRSWALISLKGGTRKTTLADTCYWTKSPLKMGHTALPQGYKANKKTVKSNDVAIVGIDKLC
jgi:hypothetical protein